MELIRFKQLKMFPQFAATVKWQWLIFEGICELGKEVKTEFGRQIGAKLSSKKFEKTKKKLEMEKNKSYW